MNLFFIDIFSSPLFICLILIVKIEFEHTKKRILMMLFEEKLNFGTKKNIGTMFWAQEYKGQIS